MILTEQQYFNSCDYDKIPANAGIPLYDPVDVTYVQQENTHINLYQEKKGNFYS